MKQSFQITKDNLGEILQLPCVEMCFKTVSKNFRVKGTFDSKAHYAKEGDWLVEVKDNKWRAMTDTEYQRIKEKI